MKPLLKTFIALAVFGSASLPAAPVYLNFQNITVALGPSMAPEPFANLSTAASLANIINAPSANAAENHISPTTHVWVSGGPLELDFNFGAEYNLSMLHFWNYFGEDFDVDNINFKFYDAAHNLVGTLLNVTPALGGGGSNPIFAENYALAFPSNVQFVNAVLTGSNGQVDFNNIGFTAERSTSSTSVPDSASTSSLLLLAVGILAFVRPRLRATRA